MTTATGRTLLVHCAAPRSIDLQAPAGFTVPEDHAIHLWYASVEGLRHQLDPLYELLDPVEQDRAARFRFEQDRERFIVGHGLLRTLLAGYLKRDASLIRMARGPFGKPYLERKRLRFNLSDTKDAILIGFTVGQELGVDIETISREVDHHAVSEHYFTKPEIAVIQAAGDASKACFLDLWTRKEAVLKASGVGIMEDLRSLRVDGERNTMVIEHEAFTQLAAPAYHVHPLRIGERHFASVALPSVVKGLKLMDASVL